MIKYLYITIAIFSLTCKNNNISEKVISNNSLTKKTKSLEPNVIIDSIPQWKNQEIGSSLLLNDFPKFWSYSSITNEKYDSKAKNKFNLILEDIEKSNNLDKLETINNIDIDYGGKNSFIPYYDSFYSFKDEVPNDDYKPIRLLKLNRKTSVALFEKQTIINTLISKRLDIVVYDNKNKIIDGLNISYSGNGDQHSFSKYFYINNGIIGFRNFYFYDGESSSSSLFNFYIKPSGKIVPYFDQKGGEYSSLNEKGQIKNNTKDGDWIEIRPNRFVEEKTYLQANYKEGKPIGKWNYYDLIDDAKKGSKLLMTEEYSEEGVLLNRKIVGD